MREASRAFPVVVLTGPRRAGKTALLRRLFPKAASQLLESPDIVAHVRADAGRRRELYFFRDERGLEVDFLIPRPGGRLALLEAKAAKTVVPSDAGPMSRLGAPATSERWVVYGGAQMLTVAPGVRAVPLGGLASALGA